MSLKTGDIQLPFEWFKTGMVSKVRTDAMINVKKLPFICIRSPHDFRYAGKKLITKTLDSERLIGGRDWALILVVCPRSSSSRERGLIKPFTMTRK